MSGKKPRVDRTLHPGASADRLRELLADAYHENRALKCEVFNLKQPPTATRVGETHSNGFDHSWAKQRSQNIEVMWESAKASDSYALKAARDVVHAASNEAFRVGDVNYSLFLSMVATKVGNVEQNLQTKKKSKARY